jgi:hypothetical protein
MVNKRQIPRKRNGQKTDQNNAGKRMTGHIYPVNDPYIPVLKVVSMPDSGFKYP